MSRVRGGYSLAEFLVASAIVALLVGLLLPGVQKVREATARTRCTNHLKQIAVAVHGYHDVRSRLPPGGSHTPPAPAADPDSREAEWSWAYHILPYLGQGAAYRSPDPDAVRTAVIPVYHCPSRRPPRLYNGLAAIDYAGNAGTQPDGENGVIRRTTLGPLAMPDITDGAHCTVLVAEKQLNVAALGQAAGDTRGYVTPGWTADFEVYRLGSAPPTPDANRPGDLSPSPAFGSSHPGVLSAAFCDGSVRTVRFTIQPTTWTRACVRDDNFTLNPNDL